MDVETDVPVVKHKEGSCWRNRTKSQKRILLLLFISFGIFILIFGITLGLNLFTGNPEIAKESVVCTSSICLVTANEILSSMNLSADPCHDFYNFVCGKWSTRYPIRDVDLASSTFINIKNQVTKNIKDILDSAENGKVDHHIMNDVLKFYRRCQDINLMEQNGVEPLLDVLKNTIGGWPVADDDWKEPNFDINSALINFHRLGFMNIMDISVNENIKDGSEYVFMIDQPKTFSFGLDWGTLMKIPATGQTAIRLEKYKEYIRQSVDVVSGVPSYDRDEDVVLRDIDAVVEFERLLARTIAPPGTRRNVWLLLNETKVSVFQNYFTQWDSLKILNGITRPVNITVLPKDNMYPIGLPYLKKLDTILSTTSARTVANFLGWVIARSFGPMTVTAFRKAELIFLRNTEGITKKSPRNWSCISTIIERLPFSIVGEYVKRYVSPETKAGIKKMIVQVRNSVLDGLDLLTWMDESTKREARNKVESIVDFVAYPDWVLNDEEMVKRHMDILGELRKSESFLEDIVKTRTYLFNLKIVQLKQKPDRKIWGEGYLYPLSTNAEYHTTNSIRIMAGILGKALFQQNRPPALNYGSMGSVIGHEIIHGLDDRGSNFDNVGILRNWWKKETMNNYKKSAQCFQNQYEEIIDPGTNLRLNGLNTLGENIADNGGIRQAFRAYNEFTRNRQKELLVLIEQFTDKQLFFLSYAHTFCEDFRQPYARSRILQETHSLNAYRVNVPLKNFKSFAEVYQCPLGSEMNPVKKCHIWI